MHTATRLAYARTEEHSFATVDYSGINQYLREISRYQLLSTEETERLAFMVHDEADSSAGRQLITANLRLVVRVVMDFQKYWMNNFLDLIQEGNVGLARAVRKFDPNRGIKFSSYAGYWIRAYILKFIMDNCRLVKIGTSQAQRKLFYQLNKEKKRLAAEGIEAETSVLSQRLQVRESEVESMGQRLDNHELSLETPSGPDGEFAQNMLLAALGPGVEEQVADEEFVVWFRAELETFKRTINEREQAILADRLLAEEPLTLTAIASRFGVSRERIRQIEGGLIDKLKTVLQSKLQPMLEMAA